MLWNGTLGARFKALHKLSLAGVIGLSPYWLPGVRLFTSSSFYRCHGWWMLKVKKNTYFEYYHFFLYHCFDLERTFKKATCRNLVSHHSSSRIAWQIAWHIIATKRLQCNEQCHVSKHRFSRDPRLFEHSCDNSLLYDWENYEHVCIILLFNTNKNKW